MNLSKSTFVLVSLAVLSIGTGIAVVASVPRTRAVCLRCVGLQDLPVGFLSRWKAIERGGWHARYDV